MTTLHQLPINEIRNLKIIRIVGPEWNWFIGYLPYLRIPNNTYKYKESDIVDEQIITSIKKSYPNSGLVENRIIFFKGELDGKLKLLKGGSDLSWTISLSLLLMQSIMTMINYTKYNKWNLRLIYLTFDFG